MSFLLKTFRFFVYSNLFIACCAVLMVAQTYQIVLHDRPPAPLIFFIFFASICSYSFHWWLTPAGGFGNTPREQWLSRNKQVHLVLFFIGLAGAASAAFFLLDHWHWLLLAAIITFFYSAPKIPHPLFRSLRKVALAKTIFLAFVWMYVTTCLPIEISQAPWHTDSLLFAGGRFFLIYAICILFDYRDREYDKQLGIRSLITWLSFKNITRLFAGSLLVFAVLTVMLFNYGYSAGIVVILLIPGLITALLYRYASRNFHDMLYYFVLDGLMALSAVMTLAMKFW